MTLAILFFIAACAVLLAPSGITLDRSLFAIGPRPTDPTGPGYQSAMQSLADVRARLMATSQMSDDVKDSIVVITQALVEGSDHP